MTFSAGLGRRSTVEDLRIAWRAGAPVALGLPSALWDVPACQALTEALHRGLDPLPAVRRFAEHRAGIGFTLDEAVRDLDVLGRLVPGASVLDRLVVGVALAEVYGRGEPSACLDPMTDLPNATYLAVRIGEVRRAVTNLGLDPVDHLGLICIQVPRAALLEESAHQAIAIAEALRRCFANGETVVAISSCLFVVLVTDGCGGTPIVGLPDAAARWYEPVPADPVATGHLLEDLARW